MTGREFFNLVIDTVENAEMVEFAKHEIQKMDNRKSRRSDSEKSVENRKIMDEIKECLVRKGNMITSDIAKEINVTVNKAGSLLVIMENNGIVTSKDVSIPKVGKRKSWSLS